MAKKREHLSLFERFRVNLKMEDVESYKVRDLIPRSVAMRNPTHEYVRVDFGVLYRNDFDCIILTTHRHGHVVKTETVQIALVISPNGTPHLMAMMNGEVWVKKEWDPLAPQVGVYSELCFVILRVAAGDIQSRYQLQVTPMK